MGETVRHCSGVSWPKGTEGRACYCEKVKGEDCATVRRRRRTAENPMDGLRD